MPRKSAQVNEVPEEEEELVAQNDQQDEDEVAKLTRLLGAVLSYLLDEELEEIDMESLLDDTEGLRDWWEAYRESNRKQLEEEIKESLGELSLKELERIREKIKGKQE